MGKGDGQPSTERVRDGDSQGPCNCRSGDSIFNVRFRGRGDHRTIEGAANSRALSTGSNYSFLCKGRAGKGKSQRQKGADVMHNDTISSVNDVKELYV